MSCSRQAILWEMGLYIIILSEVKSERERQIPYDITYMWSLKYDTKRNLPIKQKQTHRHREQTYGCHEGEAAGRNGFGVRNEQMQGIIYNG